jgi:tetratricopeptide (TPR) repeat protein/transcriptional regulator with XRE-family HTH domain
MSSNRLPVGYHRELLTLLGTLRASCGDPPLRGIAEKSNVSLGWVSGVLSGRKIPSGDVAAAIARALGATADEQRRARAHAEAATEVGQQTREHVATQQVPRSAGGKLVRDADARMLGGAHLEQHGGGGARPSPDIQPTPVTLRPPPANFVGRSAHVENLMLWMNPTNEGFPADPVVAAIVGMAGVGKTGLALHIAHKSRLAGWFTGGLLFHDMRGFSALDPLTPDAAAERLLRMSGPQFADLPDDGVQWIAEWHNHLNQLAVKGKPLLIVLDNVSNSTQVSELLPGGPHRALLTSRSTLTDLPVRSVGLSIFRRDESIEALNRALVSADANDTRISDDTTASTRLAELCGDLPLALSIAAATLRDVRASSVGNLVDEMSVETERLDGLAYNTADGGQPLAVRAAFDLSYRRLNSRLGTLLGLIACCPGPDISSAGVAVLFGESEREVRRRLVTLLRACLLESRGRDRWAMHDLLRLYASEKVVTDGIAEPVQRLFEHYRSLACAAERALQENQTDDPTSFRSRGDAVNWFDAEYSNLIAAATVAPPKGHIEIALDIARSLIDYARTRRRANDLPPILENIIAAAPPDSELIASALYLHGATLRAARRLPESIDAFEKSYSRFRSTGDFAAAGSALIGLGDVLWDARRFRDAMTTHFHAVNVFRALSDHKSEVHAMVALGIDLMELRNFDESIEVLLSAVGLARSHEMRDAEASALIHLGAALTQAGRLEEAVDVYVASITLVRDLRDRLTEAQALHNLGVALRRLGRIEEAMSATSQAFEVWKEARNWERGTSALVMLGTMLFDSGQPDQAVEILRIALNIVTELSEPHLEATALNNLGLALDASGKSAESILVFERAAALFNECGESQGEGDALNNLGLCLTKTGSPANGVDKHLHAQRIFEQISDRRGVAAAMMNAGIALLLLDQRHTAEPLIDAAMHIFRELGEADKETAAANLLTEARTPHADGTSGTV